MSRILFIWGRLNFWRVIGVEEIFLTGADSQPKDAKKISASLLILPLGQTQTRRGQNRHEGAETLIISTATHVDICPYAPFESFFIRGKNILFRFSKGAFWEGLNILVPKRWTSLAVSFSFIFILFKRHFPNLFKYYLVKFSYRNLKEDLIKIKFDILQ